MKEQLYKSCSIKYPCQSLALTYYLKSFPDGQQTYKGRSRPQVYRFKHYDVTIYETKTLIKIEVAK
jgi:hypothetical protein